MGQPDDKDSFAALFESSAQAQKRRARVRRGDRVEVKVVAISNSSVFVDLGEKEEGYFDRPDLSDRDGNLQVSIGSSISAVVAETDGEQVRLSPVFLRKQAEAVITDGTEEVRIPIGRPGPLLLEGAHIRGSVTGIERYGIFVQIEGTQGRHGRGLVPTAETGTARGADLKKHFTVGAPVEAKILAIAEDGKIRLSIKAMGEDAERGEFEAYSRERAGDSSAEPGPEGTVPGAVGGSSGGPPGATKKAEKPKPAPRNFGTLGDLLKGGAKPKHKG